MASRGRGSARPTASWPAPKHFAGYGAADGGRDYDPVDLSEAELRNVYFPPFKAAVEAGAGNVMSAYMDLNDVPATGTASCSRRPAGEWGFAGFVVSDAIAVRNLVIHGFALDLADAAARAVNAGVDMEMAIADPANGHLPEALESGAASRQAVDASVRRFSNRSSGWVFSLRRTWTRSARARCSPIRRTATWPALPRSDPPCFSGTRETCCRSTPGA